MARLAICLLGSFYVTWDGQPVTGFEYDKVRALLVYLSVQSQRPHRREALAGLFWPEQPERAALNSLRQALATLRRAIRDQQAQPPYLIISREAVQFNPASDHWLDVHEFSELLSSYPSHHHRRTGLCSACAQRLEQAAAIYQGDFLQQFSLAGCQAFEEWVLVRREELRRHALEALFRLSEHFLQLRDYPQAQHYAERQLAIDPLREQAHRQLMLGFALAGQRTAALEQYRVCQHLLAQELDVDPEAETDALYRAIRSGELKSRPRPEGVFYLNLPASLTPFIGREKELTHVIDQLENPDFRLGTIIGLGGIGKTRLAIEAADRVASYYANGVCFVSLASVGSPEFIVSAIAEALGFSFSAQADPKQQLLGHLRPIELLLVLDNFEHLLPDGAHLLAEILQTAPDVTLLVTSHERLNIYGEWVFELRGLDFPREDDIGIPLENYSAVELFLGQARRLMSHSFNLEQEKEQIAHLCRLMEGMPLAIELSASLLHTISGAEIARRVEQGIDLLQTSMIGVPERHKSIKTLFDQSWQFLTVEEREVLSILSVFQGSFSSEAAKQVADAAPAHLNTLDKKSLLRLNPDERYDIHELLKQYSGEKLSQAGKIEQAKDKHLGYFIQLAEEAENNLTGEKQAIWLEKLDVEIANLRAALDWSVERGESGLRLAGALWRFWFVRGHFHEGRKWLERALATNRASSSLSKIKVLNGAGVLAHMQGEDNLAKSYHEESLAIAEEQADQHGIAYSNHYLSVALKALGDYQRAEECSQKSLLIFTEIDERRGMSIAMRDLAGIARDRGDLMRSKKYYEEALDIRRSTGDDHGVARLSIELGIVQRLLGNLSQALEINRACLAMFEELQDHLGMANSLYHLGKIALENNNTPEAVHSFRESLKIFHRLNDRRGIVRSLEGIATSAVMERKTGLAANLFGAAQYLRSEFGVAFLPYELAEYERSIAEIRGQITEAVYTKPWVNGNARRSNGLDQIVDFVLVEEPA